MSGWTIAWLLWLAMFLAIELPAALNKEKGDTLSEHTWKWFAIRGKPEQWQLRRVILGTFLFALGAHFMFATTVIPVIIGGVGMGVVILRVTFRRKT